MCHRGGSGGGYILVCQYSPCHYCKEYLSSSQNLYRRQMEMLQIFVIVVHKHNNSTVFNLVLCIVVYQPRKPQFIFNETTTTCTVIWCSLIYMVQDIRFEYIMHQDIFCYIDLLSFIRIQKLMVTNFHHSRKCPTVLHVPNARWSTNQAQCWSLFFYCKLYFTDLFNELM